FDRRIQSGLGFGFIRVDLRHYLTGDVYEIKPLSVYGLTTAIGEAWAYTQVLNHFEPKVTWDTGGSTFPAILILPYARSSTKTLQIFAPPLMPPGAIIYTENLLRDLADPDVMKAASRYKGLLLKRIQALAPRLIQAYQRGGLAVQQTRIELSVATRGL
ncbi:MAG TPA: hypothetical protein VN844_13320, partial [Pyrinomonadaceae bacterium]|nr:hypothetical protein [Pyrinomonadaceae bacterium]